MIKNYETLDYSRHGRLAIIKLNRPAHLNALNEKMLSEFKPLLEHLSIDDSCSGMLITGNGRGFCTGADIGNVNTIKEPAKLAEQGELSYQSMIDHFNPIIQCIHDMKKPIIAAVNGVAAGYGVSLALACDLVIAAESASFIQVFVPNLGIVPDGGATWLLPRAVTQARAIGMILTGENIAAKTAKEWGMIWDCVPDELLLDSAMKIAVKLANGPTLGIASLKEAMNDSDSNSLKQQLKLEADLQKICCSSEDFAEGCAAFIEKRKPEFIGK